MFGLIMRKVKKYKYLPEKHPSRPKIKKLGKDKNCQDASLSIC